MVHMLLSEPAKACGTAAEVGWRVVWRTDDVTDIFPRLKEESIGRSLLSMGKRQIKRDLSATFSYLQSRYRRDRVFLTLQHKHKR